MLTKNIEVSDGLVNVVCGYVTHVEKQGKAFPVKVYAHFDDANVDSQTRKQHICEHAHLWNATPIFPEEERIDDKSSLRRQYPLTLAWAMTVHKVQSLTIDA